MVYKLKTAKQSNVLLSEKNCNLLVGHQGEEAAGRYFKGRGFCVVEHNFRTRFGELDLVVKKGKLLVFVEVKTRVVQNSRLPATVFAVRASSDKSESELTCKKIAGPSLGGEVFPEWQLSPRKIQQVQRMAEAYLVTRHPEYEDLRIDGVAVVMDKGGKVLKLRHWEDLTGQVLG